MELPFHLKTLPPEALDILRYYGQQSTNIAYTDEICDSTGLSDRGFGKAIRRLVTKNYLTLDGGQRYRLTDQGQRAVNELMEAEADMPAGSERRAARTETRARTVERRLRLSIPQPLVAEQAVNVGINFAEADDENMIGEPITLILQVSVLNGEPSEAVEMPFMLDNGEQQREVEITPGKFKKVRVRAAAYHLDDDTGDMQLAGGMYVDVDVLPPGSATEPSIQTYGADTRFTIME